MLITFISGTQRQILYTMFIIPIFAAALTKPIVRWALKAVKRNSIEPDDISCSLKYQ